MRTPRQLGPPGRQAREIVNSLPMGKTVRTSSDLMLTSATAMVDCLSDRRAQNMTLPRAKSNDGMTVVIQNTGSNTVAVKSAGGSRINGATTMTLNSGTAKTFTAQAASNSWLAT